MKRVKLINIRKEQNLTQKELSDILRISERHYRYIENGHRNPSIKTALRLSEILGISLEELFPKQP